MLYQIKDGTLSAGSETVLSHFNFEIKGRDKIAVVGPNGAGKTTLLRLIAGELSLDRDDKRKVSGVTLARSVTIGMLHQQAFADPDLTVEDEIMAACPDCDRWDRERFDFEQAYDRMLTGFGFDKADKHKRLGQFSGGQQTKVALIRLLLQKPDILLLDEPTNHLDMVSVQWLEDYLKTYPGAVVMVSHDRYFLDEVAEIVYELEDGGLTRYVGNYSAYRVQKQKNLDLQWKKYQAQQEELFRLNELIEKFKHKPTKAAFARSKKKTMERMPKIEKPSGSGMHLFTGDISPEYLGPKWVLETEKLHIGYDKVLLDITFRLKRGMKVGIIGENGVGKSTFLKTVSGRIPALSGKTVTGEKVTLGYFDQLDSSLDVDEKVIEHFRKLFPGMNEKDLRSFLAAYLFAGGEAEKRIGDLSGGEKARLTLAGILGNKPNFLVLDEPTNHMDIPAKETFESAFKNYAGTMLFVSHDRYFIQEVATSLLIFTDQGVTFYPFGYRHYMEHLRKQEMAGALARPAQGTPLPLQMSAEDAALLAGLGSVPKGSSLLGRELSTDQAFLEWQLSLAYEEVKKLTPHDAWEEAPVAYYEALDAWEEACIRWYDIWHELNFDEGEIYEET